tara:strand:- start:2296 stop:3609 length:1314 start_codon:yes stop_codon:yes gene_type:complete
MDEHPGAEDSSFDSVEHSYDALKRKYGRNQREIRRLRKTVSFQLGLHLTTAVRRPWRFFALPITLPLVALKLGMQRLGKRPIEQMALEDFDNHEERKHCIVLFPTNGVGFGHFTRMYAVARALRKVDPSLEIVFFTPMPTLHILYREQFPTYHLAGRYKHADMTASQWNGLVEDMLHMVFDMHRPKWFMFDGAYPYRGMLNAIASQPNMDKWWMRRGSFKSNKSIPVDSTSFFDDIIVPGEGLESNTQENFHQVSPIIAVEPQDAWERDFARSRLSVPNEARVVYVQLGAGRINAIENVLEHVLESLYAYSGLYVVLGESMLGERLPFTHDRLRIIRDYPNTMYAHAFDASVQAGGYNSYQEMRRFGIPTLFIPNTDTGMDDQLARCQISEKEGWGVVNESLSVKNLQKDIEKLFKLPKKPQNTVANGAEEVAHLLF